MHGCRVNSIIKLESSASFYRLVAEPLVVTWITYHWLAFLPYICQFVTFWLFKSGMNVLKFKTLNYRAPCSCTRSFFQVLWRWILYFREALCMALFGAILLKQWPCKLNHRAIYSLHLFPIGKTPQCCNIRHWVCHWYSTSVHDGVVSSHWILSKYWGSYWLCD